MFKQVAILSLLATALYMSSMEVGEPQLNYTFPSGKAVSIVNPLPTKLSTTCTMKTSDASDEMSGKQVKGTATIDGKEIKTGGSMKFTIKNEQKVKITATVGGKTDITNEGKSTVTATCSLNVEELSEPELNYTFPSGKAVAIVNPLPTKLSTTCTMKTADASDEMSGKQLKGTATIDGKEIKTGGSMKFTIKNGQKVKITATVGGKTDITNEGKSTVTATCSLNVEELSEPELNYTFPSGKAVSIVNPLPTKLSTTCTMKTADASDKMSGKQIKGTATIDGKEIKTGGSMTFTIKNGQKVKITATVGGKTDITNDGKSTVTASCTL